MNKISTKITAIILCGVLCVSGVFTAFALTGEEKSEDTPTSYTVFAEDISDCEIAKDETVYVLAGADGSVRKIIVSDWIKNIIGADSVSDKSELTGIENVKGDESYTVNGDATVWDAAGNDIYYMGNIEKELPVGLSVSYKLDGKTVSVDEIAGKSGSVTIRFDYENKQFEKVTIDGKEEKIYVPFVMLTGMLLDSDTFRNVTVSNGKLINDGDRTAVIGIALPGMQHNLGITKDIIDIPDYVEISADVTDFSFGMTVTLATNELFNQLDTSKLDAADGIKDSVGELTSGMKQLLDGSSSLYGGLCTLLDKSKELIAGINQLADGAKTLSDGASVLSDGADKLNDGANELAGGLNTLKENNESLTSGAKQVFETLLSTAEAQIKAGGIDVPALTIENYSKVLDGVIKSLDKSAVYDAALKAVTAAVEENRSLIVAKVTAAVRDKVAEQVIPLATGGMSKEVYDNAVSAGTVSVDIQTAVTGAIELQMQTEEVKKTVADNVELQIKQAISENMASTEVQAKLTAADEGAKSIISLKASLDSYNTFYLGLIAYTDGVASAADGAETLSGGAKELSDGAKKLSDGAAALYDGILEVKNGAPALIDGVSKLSDGAMQLSGGLKKIYEEGIQKIAEIVDGDLNGIITRLKATCDVSKNYRNFSGIGDGMDGGVKFIYRTDEIK